MPDKPLVFVASSKEMELAGQALRMLWQGAPFKTRLWCDEFDLPTTTTEALEGILSQHQYGVFLFACDDKLVIRGRKHTCTRDNVLFEFGLFYGRYGREHTFVLRESTDRQRSLPLRAPTDTLGTMDRTFTRPATNTLGAWKEALAVDADHVRVAIERQMQPGAEHGNGTVSAPPDLGIRQILRRSNAPIIDPDRVRRLLLTSHEMTFAATSHSNFCDSLTSKALRDRVRERILAGDLRLSVYGIEPFWEAYICQRSKEIDDQFFTTRKNLPRRFHALCSLKAEWLAQVQPSAGPGSYSLRGQQIEQWRQIGENLRIMTHHQWTRAGIYSIDSTMFLRPNFIHCKGGDGTLWVELDPQVSNLESVSHAAQEELKRVREDGNQTLIEVEIPGTSETYPENTLVAHLLGLVHHTVHLLCHDGRGVVYLQQRSAACIRNPRRLTSTVAGHMDVQDARIPLNALRRETTEELGETWAKRISESCKELGDVPTVTDEQTVTYSSESVRLMCRAQTHVFVANIGDMGGARSEEVSQIVRIKIDELRGLLARSEHECGVVDVEGNRYEVAPNFRQVLQAAIDEL